MTTTWQPNRLDGRRSARHRNDRLGPRGCARWAGRLRGLRVVHLVVFEDLLGGTQAGGHARLREEARERLRDILALYVALSTGVEGRRGCLVVGGAIELASTLIGTFEL